MLRIYKEDGSISVLVAVSIIFIVATISAVFIVSGTNREYQLRRQMEVKDVFQAQMDDYASIYCDIAGLGTYDKELRVNIPIFPDDAEDPTNTWFYPGVYRPNSADPIEDTERATINSEGQAVDWFNYSEKRWANAVEKYTPEGGTSELTRVWVWIPRFAVKTTDTFTGAYTPFTVVFLIGDTDKYLTTDNEGKYVIEAIGPEYYVPQAFQQLNSKRGFWIEKVGTKELKKVKYYNQTTYTDSATLDANSLNYYTSACAFLRGSQFGNGKNTPSDMDDGTENGLSTTDNFYGVYHLNSCYANWSKLVGGQV